MPAPLFATFPREVLGYVADWCVLRGEVCCFELIECRERVWVYVIPLGRGIVVGYELRSVIDPRIRYRAFRGAFFEPAGHPEPLQKLIEATNPGLLETAAALREFEQGAARAEAGHPDRLCAMAARYNAMEYWCHDRRTRAPQRLAVGILLAALAMGFGVAGLSRFPAPWASSAMGSLGLLWCVQLVYLLFTFTSAGWKAIRLPLAESLVRFDPTVDELKKVRNACRVSARFVTGDAKPRRMRRLIERARDRVRRAQSPVEPWQP